MEYILIGVFVLILIIGAFLGMYAVKRMKKSSASKQELEDEKKKNMEEEKIIATQEQLPFEDIRKGMVKLKNDTFLKVMEVSSVNTQLMEPFEREIVRETYGAVLNSLNFKIQFYKQSRLVDINEYISMLEEIERLEKSEFKSEGINQYNYFIRELIRENSVQTKKDYVVISFKEEVKKKKNKEDPDSLRKYQRDNDDSLLEENDEFYQREKMFEKAFKVLSQREKVLEKQIRRLGITSSVLNDKELFELFYTTYNRDRSVYQSMKGRNPKEFGSLYVKRGETN